MSRVSCFSSSTSRGSLIKVEEIRRIRLLTLDQIKQRSRDLADIRWFRTGDVIETLFSCFLNPIVLLDFLRHVAALPATETRNPPEDGLKELILLLDFFSCWSFSSDLLDQNSSASASLDLLYRVQQYWETYVLRPSEGLNCQKLSKRSQATGWLFPRPFLLNGSATILPHPPRFSANRAAKSASHHPHSNILWSSLWCVTPTDTEIEKLFLTDRETYEETIQKAICNNAYRQSFLEQLECLIMCRIEELWVEYRESRLGTLEGSLTNFDFCLDELLSYLSMSFSPSYDLVDLNNSAAAVEDKINKYACLSPQLRGVLMKYEKTKLTTDVDHQAARTIGGNTLESGNPMHNLAVVMVLGMRTALDSSRCLKILELESKFSHLQLCRPLHNRSTMPRFSYRHFGLPVPFLPQMSFRLSDICPDVFHWIREISGISTSEYRRSVCRTDFNFIEFNSNSKSGNFFLFSWDGKYLIKTLSKSEARRLIKFLPHYVEHLRSNPNSLLCRMFGLHRLEVIENPKNDDNGAVHDFVASSARNTSTFAREFERPRKTDRVQRISEVLPDKMERRSLRMQFRNEINYGNKCIKRRRCASHFYGFAYDRNNPEPFSNNRSNATGLTFEKSQYERSVYHTESRKSDVSFLSNCNPDHAHSHDYHKFRRKSDKVRSIKRFRNEISHQAETSRKLPSSSPAQLSLFDSWPLSEFVPAPISTTGIQERHLSRRYLGSRTTQPINRSRGGGSTWRNSDKALKSNYFTSIFDGNSKGISYGDKGGSISRRYITLRDSYEAAASVLSQRMQRQTFFNGNNATSLTCLPSSSNWSYSDGSSSRQHITMTSKDGFWTRQLSSVPSESSPVDVPFTLRQCEGLSTRRNGATLFNRNRKPPTEESNKRGHTKPTTSRHDKQTNAVSRNPSLKKPRTRTLFFMVLGTVYDFSVGIHEMFDLKGSSVSRTANVHDKVKKDNDWTQAAKRLNLSSEAKERLLSIHKTDCEFLAFQGNFDYSLLIGIHNKKAARYTIQMRRKLITLFLIGYMAIKFKGRKSMSLSLTPSPCQTPHTSSLFTPPEASNERQPSFPCRVQYRKVPSITACIPSSIETNSQGVKSIVSTPAPISSLDKWNLYSKYQHPVKMPQNILQWCCRDKWSQPSRHLCEPKSKPLGRLLRWSDFTRANKGLNQMVFSSKPSLIWESPVHDDSTCSCCSYSCESDSFNRFCEGSHIPESRELRKSQSSTSHSFQQPVASGLKNDCISHFQFPKMLHTVKQNHNCDCPLTDALPTPHIYSEYRSTTHNGLNNMALNRHYRRNDGSITRFVDGLKDNDDDDDHDDDDDDDHDDDKAKLIYDCQRTGRKNSMSPMEQQVKVPLAKMKEDQQFKNSIQHSLSLVRSTDQSQRLCRVAKVPIAQIDNALNVQNFDPYAWQHLSPRSTLSSRLTLASHNCLNSPKQTNSPSVTNSFDAEQPRKRPFITFASADGEEIYYIGIIDFITPYDFKRYFHTAWKYTKSGGPFGGEISPVPPHYYASRQIKFVEHYVVGDHNSGNSSLQYQNGRLSTKHRPSLRRKMKIEHKPCP